MAKISNTPLSLTPQKLNALLRNIYGDRKDKTELEKRVYKHNNRGAICIMGLELNKEKLKEYFTSCKNSKKDTFGQYLLDLLSPYL